MDSFDYSDDALQPTRNRATVIWNILTVIVLLITLCLCIGISTIFINPYSSLNRFPPPTRYKTPTITPTPIQQLPATWTPTASLVTTATATATVTPLPTATNPAETSPPTAVPTQTPGEGEPTPTPGEISPTPTQTDGMPFVLHLGDPKAINNIWHPDDGCNWMGVGGQAFDLSGAPIEEGLFVQLGGTLEGEPVEMLTMVGINDTFGPGIYEFVIGDTPIDSSQTLWVQLFDQAMLPLSNQIFFDTFADCDKNLILIHFDQVR